MVSTNLSKSITQPVAGLSLLALIAVACPSPTRAQQPSLDPPAAAPTANPPAAAPTANPPGVAPTANPPAAAPTANPPAVAPTANPPAAAPTATAQPGLGDVDYILGGGDRIRIDVFQVPEYTGEYQIPPGGNLYLPLIGAVTVRGLTQAEAAEVIAAKYARFLKRPLVSVSLLSPRPINVVVSGEVNRPGSFTVGLQGGAGDNPGVQYPTVAGAIALAEGATLAADIRHVKLRRRQGLGQEQVFNIDLTELIKTGNVNRELTLRDGDTIFIPTATEVNLAEIRQFSTASFSALPTQPRTVTVVGEVIRPGSYVVVGGASSPTAVAEEAGGGGGNGGSGLPTVSRAIQLAGGITSEANVRDIKIRRLTKNGAEQTIDVSLWKLLKEGDTTQDTIVQQGDTIIIPTATDVNPADATALADANFSPAAIQVSVVGEVENPGVVNVPPNTPLNQAILTAGGFRNSRAKRSSVQLVRLNSNGTVTKRKVEIDMAQGLDEEGNPSLRDNDIVVVGRSGIAKIGDTVGAAVGPIFFPFLNILRGF